MPEMPPRTPRAFGHWVRQERVQQGYSQKQLAHLLGMHPSKLCRIEKGQAPRDLQGCWQVEVFLLRHRVPAPSPRMAAATERATSLALRAWHREVLAQSHALVRETTRLLDQLQRTSVQGAAD